MNSCATLDTTNGSLRQSDRRYPEESNSGESDPETSTAETSNPDAPPDTVISTIISADELHDMLLKAHLVGNRARRRFIQALRAMDRSKLYRKFGYPTITAYTEDCFGLSRSRTYEFLQVAEAFESLSRCDEAFRNGALSWSAMRLIARVATAETAADWLKFSAEHTLDELGLEVKDAVAQGRKAPRKDRYGLPNVSVELRLKLTVEEHDVFEKAMKKIAAEMGKKLDGAQVETRDVLLFLAQRVLESDDPESLGGRVERRDSLYRILYRVCPDCRDAQVSRPEGYVNVPTEVVARVEGEADEVHVSPDEEAIAEEAANEKGLEDKRSPSRESEEARRGSNNVDNVHDVPVPRETRDRKSTRSLTRKVFLRDGGQCGNPLCRKSDGIFHAHHIRFRSHGGRTALANEVLLCPMCHALVHLGLLKINGSPLTTLRFSPKGALTRISDFEAELNKLAALRIPAVVEIPQKQMRAGGRPLWALWESESAAADGRRKPPEIEPGLVRVLRRLGYSRREAYERVKQALEKLCTGKAPMDEETILGEALRTG